MDRKKTALNRNKFISFVTLLIGSGVVASLWFFNRSSDSYNNYIVGNLIGLFFIPLMSILFIFGEEPEKFGLKIGIKSNIWIVCGVLYAGLLLLMIFGSRMNEFQSYYPIFRRFSEFKTLFSNYPSINPFALAPMQMAFAEASYGLYLFCWEFFFRGYLLFGLFRSIKWWAVIVQAVAFGILHISKPWPEVAASFIAGILLGMIAIKAKSFLPCFILHWAASITFDVLVVVSRRI